MCFTFFQILLYVSFSSFLFLTTESKTSYIEIDIYNSLIESSNYTYQLLNQIDIIYKNSNLDIIFFVKKEEYFKNHNDNISNILSLSTNKADVTLILVNLPTIQTVRGISYVNSMCSEYSIMIANTYNLPENFVPYVIAHELGHIFGANHDDKELNIMNSIINQNKIYFFTEKNKNEMNFEVPCLYNIPQNYIYMSQENLVNSTTKRLRNSLISYAIYFIILYCI